MRKAFKNVISSSVVLIVVLSISICAFADPLSIGIGLPIAEATGVGFGFTGMSATGADAWFNGQSGSDPVQLHTNYVDVDLVNDVPIKYRKNNDGTVDFQIDKDSSIFKYFNNTNGLYSAGAIHTLIANNNITTEQLDTNIYSGNALDGIPFNSVVFVAPYGDYTVNLPAGVELTVSGGGSKSFTFKYNGSTYISGSFGSFRWPFNISYVYQTANTFLVRYYNNGWDAYSTPFTVKTGSTILPSTVNYGSGEDFIFNGGTDQYLHINIPESYLSNLQLSNLFGDLSGQDFIALTEDLGQAYSDGITKANVNSVYSDEDIEDNPPVPVPTTPLGQVPFDDWIDLWGQGIYQQLENQSDALDFIGSAGEDAIEELESIDSNIGELEEVAGSIDTNIGIGNGLLGGIRSLAQSAVNYLEGIAEHVGELVEEIVEGTETLIAGILNQIPQVFSVIFGPIKQASSIWHYVVEWITSIGAPFQFIWSMASGTSYYIILPVYASLAAAVVLAFYKRFGK